MDIEADPKLHTTGNKLMLSVVEENVLEQIIAIKITDLIGEENTFTAQKTLGASTLEAL